MTAPDQAAALEALAERHETAVVQLRADALKCAGARRALADAAGRVVGLTVARVQKDRKEGKLDDATDRIVKGYLVQVQNDLLAASEAAEAAQTHTLGKAAGMEESAQGARDLAAKLRTDPPPAKPRRKRKAPPS